MVGSVMSVPGKTLGPLAVDPVGTLGKLTLRLSRSLVGVSGVANRTFLHFITGEPVQALEEMQKAGRLSARQVKEAGANPFYALFGAKHASGETLKDFGKTPLQQFEEAKKGIGGFKDEMLIFAHITDIMERAENVLTTKLDEFVDEGLGRLMPSEYQMLGKTPGGFGIVADNWLGAFGPQKAGIGGMPTRPRIPGRPMHGTGGGTKYSQYLDASAVENVLIPALNKELQPLRIRLNPDGSHRFTDTGGRVLSGADAEKIPAWLQQVFQYDLNTYEGLRKALIGDPGKSDVPGLMELMREYSTAGSASAIPEAIYNGFRTYIQHIADNGRKLDILDADDIKFINEQFMPKRNPISKTYETPSPWQLQQENQKLIDDIRDAYKMFKTKEQKTGLLNKYMAAMDDGKIAKQLLDEIEIITGESINAPIAGLIARKITPSSLVARGSAVSAAQRVVAGGTAAGAGAAGTLALSGGLGIGVSIPFLGFLAFSSPRITGNVLSKLGAAQRTTDYVKTLVRLMNQHPVGKVMAASNSAIWSVATVLDKINKYNAELETNNAEMQGARSGPSERYLAWSRGDTRTTPQTTSQFDPPGSQKHPGQRHLNPLNNKLSDVAAPYAKKDARGNPMRDIEGHLIYPSAEAGWQGGLADLRAKIAGRTQHGLNADSTLDQLGKIWAEHKGWARGVSSMSGYGLNTKLKDMDLMTLARAMARQEGWYVQ